MKRKGNGGLELVTTYAWVIAIVFTFLFMVRGWKEVMTEPEVPPVSGFSWIVPEQFSLSGDSLYLVLANHLRVPARVQRVEAQVNGRPCEVFELGTEIERQDKHRIALYCDTTLLKKGMRYNASVVIQYRNTVLNVDGVSEGVLYGEVA